MLARIGHTFGLKPIWPAADAAYGSGRMIGWLIRQKVTSYVPILVRAHQTRGMFAREAFSFDAVHNIFICPGGRQAADAVWSDA